MAWTVVALAGIAIAVASLTFQRAANFDPWGWIVWGREVLHLNLDTATGPSWKPGPVVFTTGFALFGALAPTLWLLAARLGAVLAVVMAYRLAQREAGWLAGVVAASLLLLMGGFLQDAVYGQSDSMMVGLLLFGIDNALESRQRTALAALLGASLMRPEVVLILAAYSAYLWRKPDARRIWIVTTLGLFPLLWFGGDWVGSGNPFMASVAAKQFQVVNTRFHTSHPALTMVKLAGQLLHTPALLLAVAALTMAVLRRDRFVLGLTAAAVALFVVVAAMAQDGYPVLGRFLFGSIALVFILSGIGLAQLVSLAARRQVFLGVVAAAAFLGGLAPLAIADARAWKPEVADARQWSQSLNALPRAIAAAGGRIRILACRGSITTYYLMRPALAWDLGTNMNRTFDWDQEPNGVIFAHGSDSARRVQPRRPLHVRRLAVAAGWKVLYVVTHVPARASC